MTVAATPRAEALAGAALQASKFLVAVVDADGRIVHANPALERATGRQGDDLRGAPLMDIVGIAEEKASVRAACAQLGSGRFPPAMFFHLVTGASELRVVDWSNVVLPRDAGAPPVAVCIGIELSQRTETNQLLRKTEERQRLLLERIPAVVWTTDCALRFTSSVGGALVQLGLSPDQVAAVGTSLYAYFQTDDSTNPVIAAHLAALRGECSNLDTVWLGRTFQLRVEPLRDPTGAMIGTIGVALDVTERRRMEVSLRDNEGRLRRIVDANVIGILFWRGPQILDANRAFLDMVGFTAEEIAAGRVSWRELTPPEYAAHDERAMRELAERGIFTPFEKEYFHKDGTRVPILLGGAIFEGTNDEGIAFVLDLREEVRLRRLHDDLLRREQDALREANQARHRLQVLAEASKGLTRSLQLEETLENLARLLVPGLADWCYVAHMGWDGGPSLTATAHADPAREELLATLRLCRPSPDAPDGAPRVFRTGQPAVYADIGSERLDPCGERWPVVGTRDAQHLETIRALGMRALLCVPIEGNQGIDAVMMLVSSSDPRRYGPDEVALASEIAKRAAITLENVRLFTGAIDAVRARDEFLAVAAHELRTPMTSTLLYIQSLQRLAGAGADGGPLAPAHPPRRSAASLIEASERQLQKLARLIDQLLDVSRVATQRVVLRIEEVDWAQLVRDVLGSLSLDLQRARCPLTLNAPPHLTGRWDATRLEQVTTNLLGNALKFGAGQPVDVTLEAVGPDARLSVRDHGIGISHDDQERIFGRFERAVSLTHFGGMGLGLYVTNQIVRALGGTIRVDSKPGQGATFIVELPRE